MNSRVLVLGAGGRLGHKAAEAFRDAGWTVTSLVRPGRAARAPAGTQPIEVDALDHAAVSTAARGADVILHALNPFYTDWSRLALPLAYSAITAAETTGATLMFPGNLYNYGSPMPPVIDETTPMRPSSRKGQMRVAMEDRMAEATERGMRAIVLRAGDFYGGGRGSWLDLVLLKEIGRGRLTYPGPIDLVHEWAYLPDLVCGPRAPRRDARDAAGVCDVRLPRPRGDRPRLHHDHRAGDRQQASDQAHDMVAHPCVAPVRTAVSGVVRDGVSLAGAAPDRREQAQGRDRRRPAYAA